jgi:hypothetical protein
MPPRGKRRILHRIVGVVSIEQGGPGDAPGHQGVALDELPEGLTVATGGPSRQLGISHRSNTRGPSKALTRPGGEVGHGSVRRRKASIPAPMASQAHSAATPMAMTRGRKAKRRPRTPEMIAIGAKIERRAPLARILSASTVRPALAERR